MQTEIDRASSARGHPPSDSVGAEHSVGSRLQEERVRLGHSQTELAELLGISRTSATLYEAGKHLPRAEVLAGLDSLGADILYILTGKRAQHPVVNLDLLAFSFGEAKRQSSSLGEQPGDRVLVDRAWSIYVALEKFAGSIRR
jgi:transcriptional regulator with XRE-family HTH domain